jgi:DNA-binding NtrC family response regulator
MADILVIHDQAHLRQCLLDHARVSGHSVLCADDLIQARTNAKGPRTFAVVVIGAIAGERPAIVVGRVKASWPTAEVVVTARIVDIADVAEAVRHGAYDCVKSSEPRQSTAPCSSPEKAVLARKCSPGAFTR